MTRFDLHIHSALSACAENSLSPLQIINKAAAAGIKLLAVTDHNNSSHVPLACRLGAEQGITVIPAMEASSREEVHMLTYFRSLSELKEFQELIDRHIPQMENDHNSFGWQPVYDENDEIIDLDIRMRQLGSSLSLTEIIEAVHKLNGKVVPAHAYRPRYSLISQLGFIDPSNNFDALEISWKEWRKRNLQLGDKVEGIPAITGSDSHFLEDPGRRFLELEAEPKNLEELADCLFNRTRSKKEQKTK